MNKKEELLKRIAGEGDESLGMNTIRNQTVRVTAAELGEACKLNPDHPVAAAYTKAIQNLRDDYSLAVEAVDLQCLLEDKEVCCETKVEDVEGFGKVPVTEKKVGDSRKGKAKPKTPPPE